MPSGAALYQPCTSSSVRLLMQLVERYPKLVWRCRPSRSVLPRMPFKPALARFPSLLTASEACRRKDDCQPNFRRSVQPDPSKHCGPYHLPSAVQPNKEASVGRLTAPQAADLRSEDADIRQGTGLSSSADSHLKQQMSDAHNLVTDSEREDADQPAQEGKVRQTRQRRHMERLIVAGRPADAASPDLYTDGERETRAAAFTGSDGTAPGEKAGAGLAQSETRPLSMGLGAGQSRHDAAMYDATAVQAVPELDGFNANTAGDRIQTGQNLRDVDKHSRRGGVDGAAPLRRQPRIDQHNHDTIAMVAIDTKGSVAAGASSNGANHKARGAAVRASTYLAKFQEHQ